MDQQLFRRSTWNACDVRIHKEEFVDDVVLLASTREAAGIAVRVYMEVDKSFGLTLSFEKTKFMVVGYGVDEGYMLPLDLPGGSIDWVSEFPYHGSLIAESGRAHKEVDRRIASSSRVFGALRRPIFVDPDLSITIKRYIYRACVLSVLLYESECWVPLKIDLKKLNSFHHRCIKAVLKIKSLQQLEEHLSSAQVRECWSDRDTIDTIIMRRRMEWLGHLARMSNDHLPKMVGSV